MSAICGDCKQPMIGNGCTFNYIGPEGAKAPEGFMKRSLEHWCDPGGNCFDCGAPYGTVHHFGCDEERCPKCGSQLIGCECWGEKPQLAIME